MIKKNTKFIGDQGEDKACNYLCQQGFVIVERNWKLPQCEIDIIAKQDKRLYFVEVKTRKTNTFGSGLDYITPKKLNQMAFAAQQYVAHLNWNGEYQLAAIGVTDNDIEFVTIEN